MTNPKIIRIAAALIIRSDGRVLLVRKQGTVAFMQPGGKIEPGETPIATLSRELHEELELNIAHMHPAYLGRFSAPAANEAGWTVDADIFRIIYDGFVRPAAEIAEITWVDPAATGDIHLAPLTRDHILPLCIKARA